MSGLRVLLFLPLLLLMACGGRSSENIRPPRELVNISPTVDVQRIWSRKIGDVGGTPGLRMAVHLANDRLYAANTRGQVLVLDAGSGTELARFDTGHALSTTPAAADGVIALGTLDGRLIVLDEASGEERLAVRLSSEVIAPPVVAEGMVFVRSHDGRISAFRLVDGSRAWVQEYSVPILSLRGNGMMVYERGYLLVGLDDGRLTALGTADGVPVWEQPISIPEGRTDLERLSDVDGEFALLAGVAYAAGMNGQLTAVDVAGGSPLWTRELSSSVGVTAGDNMVIAADVDGTLWGLDRAGGASMWSQDALEHRWLSTPAMVGSQVAVGDLEGYVHFLDPSDGTFVARVRAGRDAIRSAPVSAGNLLYVVTIEGELTAYRVGS